ncbi:MAG: hypothetical protein M5U16_16865 [Hyphomicrobium sp.]|nr:hypothetical protein [Hyphomicrobium sp.]
MPWCPGTRLRALMLPPVGHGRWEVPMAGEKVLVTGASGFIAKHCIAELIRQGYAVQATPARPRARGGNLARDRQRRRNGG